MRLFFWWTMAVLALVTSIASQILLPRDYSRDTYQLVLILFFCYKIKECKECQ